MYTRLKDNNFITLLVVMVIIGLWAGSATGADDTTGVTAIHNSARPVQDSGSVMEVDSANSVIVVAEIEYVVGRFRVNNKVHITQLLDSKGNKVGFDHFKADQWVVLSGYQVSQGKIYADKIQAVANQLKKDNRTLDKMKSVEK